MNPNPNPNPKKKRRISQSVQTIAFAMVFNETLVVLFSFTTGWLYDKLRR